MYVTKYNALLALNWWCVIEGKYVTFLHKTNFSSRLKKQQASDPDEKAKYQQEIDEAQKAWSEINKKLVQKSREMEEASQPKKRDVVSFP